MSEEEALLQAVYAEPDDDTPRLVYADWLQENGQPERAEFIRVQIELSRLEPWAEKAVELSVRELHLLNAHRDQWRAELPPFAKRRSYQAEFRRGFPYSLSCTALQYVKNAPQLAKESAIQGWSLSGLTENAGSRLARSKSFSRVRGLALGGAAAGTLRTVLTSPHLAGLREFTLTEPCAGEPETVPQLGALFESRSLLSVRRLQLRPDILWLDGAAEEVFRALMGARFSELTSLAIEFPHASGVPCEAFAASSFLTGLVELDVGTIGWGAAQYVTALQSLPGLRVFRCGVWNVPSDVDRLLKAPAIQNVVELSITGMRETALEAFLAAPFLEQLRVLKCSVYSTTHFARLLDSGRLRGLLKLEVHTSDAAVDEIAQTIANSRGLPNLRYLAGISSQTSPGLLDTLTTTPNLPNLRMATNHPWGQPIGRFADG